MRSSKRSRGKQNRNRNNNPGNIINRVFDSSGPEGKVRGTPQQIIDKYTQLARDAALGNDRVAAENFQQHSEHYTRLLGEAQREVDARRAAAEEQNRQRQQQQREEREAREAHKAEKRDAQKVEQAGGEGEGEPPRPARQTSMDPGDAPQPAMGGDVIDAGDEADSGLVETPESKPKKRAPRPRKPRAPKAEMTDDPKPEPKTRAKPVAKAKDAEKTADGPETPEAAE
ncbi:DUF4167 domain-containing protein [Aliiroseovarius sp.]|uniref:DUF4167 domain-containing protein n=1 Tax=Aliiroseovarius sp. TaxID=1872442 RepID=UPI00261F1ACA|nr:DUF4167 domain-containing protein [Aliiroseovarius sp.]